MIIKQDYGTLTGGELEVESIITHVQKTLTADKSYAIGESFIYDGKMYKTISAITLGSSIIIGTNAVDDGTVMDKINSKVLDSTKDLDDIKEFGNYTWGPSNVPSNAPVASQGADMQVLRYSNASITQVVYENPAGLTPTIYIRSYTGGAWTAWNRLASVGLQQWIKKDLNTSTPTATINLPNSYRGVIFGFGGINGSTSNAFLFLIRVSGSGNVVVNEVFKGSNVTRGQTTNTLTITINSGDCTIADLSFSGVPTLSY